MSATLTIARYTLLEAMRSRLVWLIVGFTIVGLVLSVFVGEIALIEVRALQCGLLGVWLRTCAVFTTSLFVVMSVVRELDDKRLELVLSMPVRRETYYIGKLIGGVVVAVLAAFICALALMLFAPPTQVLIWAVSLCLELCIVIAMSLLSLFTCSQITWALSVVIGFYVLSRAMAALQLIAHGPLIIQTSAIQPILTAGVDALAFVLPDLDRFTESDWLIYGTGTVADLGFAAMQTAIYVALLAAAALFDLHRKTL